MTEPDNFTPTEEVIEAPKPPLYSKRSIRLFSIFFSTFAGGILLRQNLKDVGNHNGAQRVILFSILYTVVAGAVANAFAGRAVTAVGFLLNIIGSFILNEYFFEKAVPDADSYPKKTFWKPLIIWLLISAVFITLIIVGGGLPKQ